VKVHLCFPKKTNTLFRQHKSKWIGHDYKRKGGFVLFPEEAQWSLLHIFCQKLWSAPIQNIDFLRLYYYLYIIT
jgi:hypothetical protein